jgi:outer membrane immunogenic protein
MAIGMKLITLATAVVVWSITPAWSADLPVKAIYKAPPVDVWTWAGFYGGINAGYSLGNDPFLQASGNFGQPNGPVSETGRLNSVASPSGAVLGGQVGYNWQFDHVVLGLEGDAQWTGQSNTSCSFFCLENNVGEISAATVSQKLTWFGTVRARLGWTNGENLFYVTGGPAFGRLRQTVADIVDFAPNFTSTTDTTSAGWAAGVGIETRLWGNWTWKAEYLHVQLAGSSSFADIPQRCGLGNCSIPFSLSTAATSLRDEIVRVGLNYHLGGAPSGPAAALSPTPPAPATWTGFYAGLNGGYGYSSDPYSQTDSLIPCTGGGCSFSSYANANITPHGPVVGGQAGYDRQIQHLVVGVEADMDWSDQHAVACSLDCESDSAEPNSLDRTLNWIATFRGRIGVQNGGYFFYGTGGAALAKVTDVTSLFGVPQSLSLTRAGWAAGVGLEARLWGRWTGKIEYLHLDLGSITDTQFSPGLLVSSTTGLTDNLVRVGLNYQFAQ